MPVDHDRVREHYTAEDLGRRILDALAADGNDLDALTVDDLAPVDAFHIRGRAATEELARAVSVGPDDDVLDVGSGIGGTARYLSANFGCTVTGVDLTEAYCEVARTLSALVGLDDRTAFSPASALALPFKDDRFDVVWTEHVQMNIADKAGFYAEIARVLRPGGQFAFHDILAGGSGERIRLPVPWASEHAISHLIRPADLRDLLAGLGLTIAHWQNTTAVSTDFFRTVLDRVENHGWNPLGLHLIMGDDAVERFRNVLRNLEDDRLHVVQAVCRS